MSKLMQNQSLNIDANPSPVHWRPVISKITPIHENVRFDNLIADNVGIRPTLLIRFAGIP
jgi:hypothetical protein